MDLKFSPALKPNFPDSEVISPKFPRLVSTGPVGSPSTAVSASESGVEEPEEDVDGDENAGRNVASMAGTLTDRRIDRSGGNRDWIEVGRTENMTDSRPLSILRS